MSLEAYISPQGGLREVPRAASGRLILDIVNNFIEKKSLRIFLVKIIVILVL